jgi:uncharacterized protein involved in response to NO
MSLAFALIVLAALTRVVLPVLLPAYMNWAIGLAGVAWVIAYGAFIVCYAPILLSARVDGRPG